MDALIDVVIISGLYCVTSKLLSLSSRRGSKLCNILVHDFRYCEMIYIYI